MPHSESIPPLARAIAALHRSNNLDQLRIAILHALPELFSADGCCFYLIDKQFEIIERYPWHVPRNFMQAIERLRPHDQLMRYCIEQRCVVDCARVTGLDKWRSSPLYQLSNQHGYENLVIAPVIMKGRVIGTFNLGRCEQSGPLSVTDLDCLSFFCEEISEVLARLGTFSSNDDESGISPQAQQVAAQLINGASNKEIASKLDISVNTVKYHIKRLYDHYQVKNRVQLMKFL